MKILVTTLTALVLMLAAPAMAGERGGGGHGGGGGGCGGSCGGGGHGGGHGGGGYPGHGGGYNANVNVNVNANANAYAGAYAGAGAYINARGYDVGAIQGRGGYGGTVVHGSGYGGGLEGGYGGHYGAVYVSGPGYGPSRPFGYVAQGFGRRYVTTDRCGGGCYVPPSPPPSPCRDRCDGPGPDYGHGGGHGGGDAAYQGDYSRSSGGAYGYRESYSERTEYAGGSVGGYGYEQGDRYPDRRDDGPRYAPIPYHAAPLEPQPHDGGQGYGSPYAVGGYSGQAEVYAQPYDAPAYVPSQPQVYQPAPIYVTPPADYYGDLPPGDTGQGYTYRQEPGERG